MKKTEIKKLDKQWSELIRSKGKCEVCNATTTNNAHHIVGRRNFTLRWDLHNGCCLCSGCHTFKRESAHQDPIWFEEWLEVNRKEDLDYIRSQRNKVLKQTFEEVIEQLKEESK